MLHDLLGALPSESLGRIIAASAVAAAVLGVVLWLVGSRFSRTIITLQLVSLGASLGMYVPMVMGWRLEGWATALGAALALGATGFFFHRFWVALGLGLILAGWAAVATWGVYNNAGEWHRPVLPTVSAENLQGVTTATGLLKRFPPEDFVKPLWASVPGEVQRQLPYSCGGAAVWGLIVGLLWPRIGIALLYSCLGTSILAGAGLYARGAGFEWAGHLPTGWQAQAGMVAGMAVFGSALQWWMDPLRSGLDRSQERRPDSAVD